MKLSNPVKKQLALDLVAAAIKKNSGPLIKTIKKLEDQWVQAYKSHFITTVPEIPEARWPELLAAGVLKSAAGMGGTEVMRYKDSRNDPNYSSSTPMGDYQSYSKAPKDWLIDLVANTKGPFSAQRMFSVYGRDNHIKLIVHPASGLYAIPAASTVEYVDLRYAEDRKHSGFDRTPQGAAWYKLASPLVAPTEELARLMLKVFVDAEKQYANLTQALSAVGTRAQLIELFPEAEQFLPEPPAPKSKIVPANLFSDARKMLETGIPT